MIVWKSGVSDDVSLLLKIRWLGIFAIAAAFAQAEPLVPDAKWEALPPHPRLFANAAKFSALKDEVATHPEAKKYYELLKKRADELLSQPPVTDTLVGRRLLAMSRQAEECILVSALVFRISGEAKYGERALTEMRALATFPNWNPSHFLDVAEATFGMAVGYDWLFDLMPAEERQSFASVILKKGLKESFPAEGKKEMGWIRGTNNWNQVCHSGMVTGALAIAERDPELSKKVVERALANLHFSANSYAPDGVYPEGPGYWDYGTSYHVALITGLRSVLGDAFGMDRFPGFMKTADFITHAVTPAGRFFNYADSTPQRGFEPALFWFADELQRQELLRRDLGELDRMAKKGGPVARMMPLGLVWWNPAPAKESASPAKSFFGNGEVPVAMHRSAWGDPMAAFVATKGGRPGVSHGHMDVGEFVFESEGICWAADLGMQDYNSLESKGVGLWENAQDGERWKIFRLGAESHNILRFNDAPQRVNGHAKVIKNDLEKQFTIFDLTDVYQPEVSFVKRGVRLLPDGTLIIQDEWKSGDKAAAVAFQWLTRSEVKVSGRELTLTEAGRTLIVRALGDAPLKIEVQDFSKPVAPYDAPNPQLKRIRISLDSPAGSEKRLTVIASRQGADSPAVKVVPLADW